MLPATTAAPSRQPLLTTPASQALARPGSRLLCRCYAGVTALPRISGGRGISTPSAAACHAQRPQQQQLHNQQHQQLLLRSQPRGVLCRAAPEQQQQQQQQEGERPVVYNKEFGYSRKDVLIIIVGLIGLGVLMYEGLQAMGMDAGIAGNWVQATIFLGICVGWVSTYLWRVANKKMTYAQQLEMYESAVMQKRLEEMTEAELQSLMAEVEADKARLAAQREAMRRQQQSSSSGSSSQ